MKTRTIYVLDHNESFCQFLQTFFEKMDVTGVFFTELRPFYREINKDPEAIALIDLDFGGNDGGFKVIEHIRDLISKKLLIFAMATRKEAYLVDEALEYGANDFVFKPLDKLVLISKLCIYLDIDVKEEWELSNIVVPFMRSESIQLLCDVDLVGIDELGLNFLSQNFIVPGTVIKLRNPTINKILRADKPILMTVAESTLDSEKGLYHVSAKFSGDSTQYTGAIRAWIAFQKSACV